MTFVELLKDVLDSSKQRTKSPITGTYIISFIIWNWRALIFLLFEKTTITNKIIIINHEYSSFWTVAGPLIITFIYVLLVPFLTMLLEKALIITKKANLKSIYLEKIYDTQEKTILAKEEIKLQDVISRKREVEELLEQIDNLRNKIKDDEEINKAIINDYKSQIYELTNRLNSQNQSKTRSSINSNIDFIKSFSQLSENEKTELLKIPITIDNPIPKNIHLSVINFLMNYEYAIINNDKTYLTLKGVEFLLLLQDKE